MRGSAWILAGVALALWVGAVALPAAGVGIGLATAERVGGPVPESIRPAGALFAETTGYALAVTLGATLLGWGPGRLLGGRLAGRGYALLTALFLLPLCIPAYVVFYAWWQAWPPDSAIYAWAVRHEQVGLLRQATLLAGLICWSWPLVAWPVAAAASLRPAVRDEMLRLDGAGRATRLLDALRCDARGLAIGALLVFLAAFTNTTCFDLAQIFTVGNELRAVDASGAGPRAVLLAALPATALAALAAGATWRLLGGVPAARTAQRPASPGVASSAIGAIVYAVTVLGPLVMLLAGFEAVTRRAGGGVGVGGKVHEFAVLYRRSLEGTVALAAVSGVLGAVIATGLAAAWLDRRRVVRVMAHVQAVGWLALALAPATVVAIGLEAAYNRPLADAVYRGPAILIVGHLARFGFVAALLARWAAAREPRSLGDLRRLDGAETLRGLLTAARPRLVAAAGGGGAIVAALALSEIPVTARVHPPGSDPLAVALIDAMHHQHPLTVILAALALLAAACVAVAVTAAAWMPLRRAAGPRRAAAASLAAAALLLGGCAGGEGDDGSRPLPVRAVFGSTGTALGQFAYPRCIDVDPARGFLYVIDKTARVQRYTLDGKPQLEWRTPEKELGKPTGVSVAPDGRVFVADTHYHRILAYDGEGHELMRFGQYGLGPGEFVYPTDVAFGPEGRLYVSEYGGHDRIQVFAPDGVYLFEFGEFGSGPGQFSRPQSLAFDRSQRELYITDACNHRIVVVDADGRELRHFGTAGTGPGQMHYPYGLAVLPDGTLLVAEFGGNRVQRLDPTDGSSLGCFGRLGTEEGDVRYPWGVAVAGTRVFVLDSGNDRVQEMRIRDAETATRILSVEETPGRTAGVLRATRPAG